MSLVEIYPYRPPVWHIKNATNSVSRNKNQLQVSHSGKTASSFFAGIQSRVRQSIAWVRRRMAVGRLSAARNEVGKPYWHASAIDFHKNTNASFDNLVSKRKADASLLNHEFERCLKQLDAKGEYEGLSTGRRHWIAYSRARATVASYRQASARSIYAHLEKAPTLDNSDTSGNVLYQAHMKYAENKTDEMLALHFKVPAATLKAWAKLDEMWEKYKSLDEATKQAPETLEDLKPVCRAVLFEEYLKISRDLGHTRSAISEEVEELVEIAFAGGLPASDSKDSPSNPLAEIINGLSRKLSKRRAKDRINRDLSLESCEKVFRARVSHARKDLIGKFPSQLADQMENLNRKFDTLYDEIVKANNVVHTAQSRQLAESERESPATTFARATANAFAEVFGQVSEEHAEAMTRNFRDYPEWKREMSSLPSDYLVWMNRVLRHDQVRLEAGLCLPKKVRQGAPAPYEKAPENR